MIIGWVHNIDLKDFGFILNVFVHQFQLFLKNLNFDRRKFFYLVFESRGQPSRALLMGWIQFGYRHLSLFQIVIK